MCVNVLQKRDLATCSHALSDEKGVQIDVCKRASKTRLVACSQSRTHMVKEAKQTRKGWVGGRRRTEDLVPSWLGTIGPQVPQQEADFSSTRGVMTPCGAGSR
jgi:hypothetical protein